MQPMLSRNLACSEIYRAQVVHKHAKDVNIHSPGSSWPVEILSKE